MLNSLSRRARMSALLTTGLLALSAAMVGAPAQADDSSTLTVVGTSDVDDSNLVNAVIKPGFEAANPGITLNYVSLGTGQAIAYAKAGTASALVVHAASLENQFVGDGYSLEKYGRAIFWGDYVLLGPANDPAHVMTDAPHDIATAFEKIAAAGVAGTANFVSRANTSGTSVQEHAIWALTQGVSTCPVSDANGGGTAPTSGACGSSPTYPSWYRATNLKQGPNVTNADACNYSPAQGECYTLTDRGTFNFLQSEGQAQNLQIVTRDNDASARGGVPLLVNSFHAYALNPAKFSSNPNVQINSVGATKLLDWITSPAGQTAIGNYLNGSNDPPFLPSAAPKVTTSSTPTAVMGGHELTWSGTVSNVVPGTPNLKNLVVKLMAVPAYAPTRKPVEVASAKADSAGHYVVRFTPLSTMTYSLATDQVAKIENSTLNPIFGDLLAPTTTRLGTVRLQARVTPTAQSVVGQSVRLRGTLQPRTIDKDARLYLYAAKGSAALTNHGVRELPAGRSTYDYTFKLGSGTWRYELRYIDSGVFSYGTSSVRTVTIR